MFMYMLGYNRAILKPCSRVKIRKPKNIGALMKEKINKREKYSFKSDAQNVLRCSVEF